MTVIPPPLHGALKAFERIFGPVAIVAGLTTLAGLLIREFRYFAARAPDPLFADRANWAPVLIFLPPALHLICFGRRMMLNRGVSLQVRIEAIFILIGLTLVALLVFT